MPSATRRPIRYDALPDRLDSGHTLAAIYPYHTADGDVAYEVRRYERASDGDKRFLQATPRGGGLWVLALEAERVLYHLPALLAAPTDAPVIIVEGEKCCAAAQAASQATGYTWAVTTTAGGAGNGHLTPLDALARRCVVILPDHDTPGERYAATIAERAHQAGAARVVTLRLDGLKPHGDVVDWLAAGHTGAELAQRITDALATPDTATPAPSSESTATPEPGEDEPYRATPGGLRRIKREVDQAGGQKDTLFPLTNFNARIVADTLEDDGADVRRIFDMEATLCVGDPARRAPRYFQLPADRFGVMSWPTEHLGAAAIVYPGQSAREHARVAIQSLSGVVPERRVFTHTGWRHVDDAWVYLHAGGAIGATGVHADVSVALSGDLARYELPTLPESDAQHGDAEIIAATRASIRMLEVAPITVTAPLWGAIWRAPLGNADFAVHVGGQTGEGKSELAALAQQHYGPTMDARHLPASWSSTGNALEAQAFHAKDALLVVDDFIPTGTTADAQRLHGVAERVLRAQGNNSGRQRLHADTTQRPTKPPRGLILSTGEDIPRGTSLRARLLVVEHAPGTMDWQKLSVCQRDAASGRYALAMAGFIRWLAARYEDIQAELRPQAVRDALADRLGGHTTHRRTSDNVAQLIAAVAIFTRYAREIGALTTTEATALLARVEQALLQVGEMQATLQAQGDPVTRFLTLLNTAIMSGAAYVADRHGEHPGDPETPWGWRLQTRGTGENMTVDWVPIGKDKVGWLDGQHLYILPDAAYAAAQRIGQASGDALTVTSGTLWKRLRERGFLLSWDEKRQTHRVRVTAEGSTQNVLDLPINALTSLAPLSPDTDPTSVATPASSTTGVVSDAQPPAGAHVSRDDSHTSAPNPSPNPDNRAEVLQRAERLGWPDLQIAPHLRIPNERAWRSVARASDADVSRALAALTRHAAQHAATVAGGATYAANR